MDYTPIFQAVLGLLATLITVFVIPYIKSHTSDKQFSEIQKWAKVAAECAQQTLTENADKRAYVKDFLAGKGIKLSEKEIDALLESAVYLIKKGE